MRLGEKNQDAHQNYEISIGCGRPPFAIDRFWIDFEHFQSLLLSCAKNGAKLVINKWQYMNANLPMRTLVLPAAMASSKSIEKSLAISTAISSHLQTFPCSLPVRLTQAMPAKSCLCTPKDTVENKY
jgi:hypothetical protein